MRDTAVPRWVASLLGDTTEDRRRSLGLLGMAVLLSPLVLTAELLYALGVPCRCDRQALTREGGPWT